MENTKNKHSIDMQNGPITKNIIKFALPVAASSILQQLFNSADTAIAGKFGTPDALAAVGTNGEKVALFVSLSAGLAVGANVVIAHLIGAGESGNKKRCNKIFVVCLVLVLVFSAVP